MHSHPALASGPRPYAAVPLQQHRACGSSHAPPPTPRLRPAPALPALFNTLSRVVANAASLLPRQPPQQPPNQPPSPPQPHPVVAAASATTQPAPAPPGTPPPPGTPRGQDYSAAATDEGVLRLPPRAELEPAAITHVFGYARDLLDRYRIGKVIGAGSFGVVRECIELATGQAWAIKTVSKTPRRGSPTPRYLLKLRNEVEIMKQLGFSLDAVNLRDVFEDDASIHLVMELCRGGALLERVDSQGHSEARIASVVRSILRFISQCHAKGIIYRDIKPDNFLFVTKGDDSHIRATDFGLSIRHWPDQEKLTARSGTPAYMAPELVHQRYDCKSDVWSVGMMSYQLLTGRFPFWTDMRNLTLTEVWQAVMYSPIPWDSKEIQALSPDAVDFLQRLLERDPELRPSAQDALQHPWLQERGPATAAPLQGSVVQRLQRFSTYGRLKQLVLKMVVDEMQGDAGAQAEQRGVAAQGIMGLEELFESLDVDHSGDITLQELATGLKQQGYQLTQSEVDMLVRGIDVDQDQRIRLPEFISTMLDWNVLLPHNSWQVYLDRVFVSLDQDGDGFIDLAELSHLLRGAIHPEGSMDGHAMSADYESEQLATAKQMLREADLDGDGHISRAEFQELLNATHTTPDSLFFYDDRLGAPAPAAAAAVEEVAAV